MTNYIKLSDLTYPHTERSIKSENPQTSYPATFPVPEGYAIVFTAPQPTYDAITQFARQLPPLLTVKGTWEEQWEVVNLDADTILLNQTNARKNSVENARTISKRRPAQVLAHFRSFHCRAGW